MIKEWEKHLIIYNSSIKDALARLDKLGAEAVLLIIDEENRLKGSLSDGDVRRGIMNGALIEHPVSSIMHRKPKFIKKGDTDINKIVGFREAGLRVVPIIDGQDRIERIISFRDKRSYLPLDAVIMAGGKGERLRPLTESIPKPMLRIGSKPILERSIESLSKFGICDIWISINYLGEQIQEFFGDGSSRNINISYVKEEKPLGTIGSASLIDTFRHEHVLVMNSDIITDLDYERFYQYFLSTDADLAVLSVPFRIGVPYAVLETRDNTVFSLQEKPTYTYYSNGGMYLMKRSALRLMTRGQHFNATDLMTLMIERNMKVVAYNHNGMWIDIGRKEDLAKADSIFEMVD